MKIARIATHRRKERTLRTWRIPVALALLSGIFAMRVECQVIYDLAEMDSDVQLIGRGSGDDLARIAVFDFNDNGLDDVIIGGFSFTGSGHVYGIFDRPLVHGSVIDLLDSQIDLDIYGGSGISVGTRILRCDINADGIGDLAISHEHFGDTAVYIFLGSSHWNSKTVIDLSTEPADITLFNSFGLGCDLASADLNNDGLEDLIIGAERAANPIGWSTGAVYVFFAGPQYSAIPMTIDLSTDPADLTIYGYSWQDLFGHSLATGDVNHDGIRDLIVGAYNAVYADDKLGRAYVFFGSSGWPAHHVIDLSTQSADLTLIGPQWYCALGLSVASGDINGDGIDDILAGAHHYDGKENAMGAGFAVFGRTSFTPGETFDLGGAEADLTCIGEAEESLLGSSMGAGDLDGDGTDEWAICALNFNDDLINDGRGFVIEGSTQFPPHGIIDFSVHQPTMKVFRNARDDDLLVSDAEFSDVNGDGLDDLILASSRAGLPDRSYCGKIYIFFGHAPLDAPPRVLAGPGPYPANRAEVRLYNPYDHDRWLLRLTPYLVRGYGAQVATADLDAGGYDRMIVGTGPGPHHPPLVTVLDDDGSPLAAFLAYGTPRFGVNLSAGDLDGDGRDEIVTGAGPGEVYGPHVRGWRYAAGSVTPMPEVSFLAYGTRRWGVNVAAGDLDGDGREEIATGAGPGAVFGPHVRAWRLEGGTTRPMPQISFLAYGTNRYGVRVACGDIDGDGIDEIVTGPGPSEQFGSHVRGWNYDGQSLAAMGNVNFFAYPETMLTGGVVVACGDIDNDGNDEILTTPGPLAANPPWMKAWNHDGVAISLNEQKSFMVFEEGHYGAGANIALGNFREPPDYLP